MDPRPLVTITPDSVSPSTGDPERDQTLMEAIRELEQALQTPDNEIVVLLNDAEANALTALAALHDLSLESTMVQALRVYQLWDTRHREGARCVWLDKDGRELDGPVGCPALD